MHFLLVCLAFSVLAHGKAFAAGSFLAMLDLGLWVADFFAAVLGSLAFFGLFSLGDSGAWIDVVQASQMWSSASKDSVSASE